MKQLSALAANTLFYFHVFTALGVFPRRGETHAAVAVAEDGERQTLLFKKLLRCKFHVKKYLNGSKKKNTVKDKKEKQTHTIGQRCQAGLLGGDLLLHWPVTINSGDVGQ